MTKGTPSKPRWRSVGQQQAGRSSWFATSRWSPDGRKLAGWQVRPDGLFMGISIYFFGNGWYDRVTDFGGYPRWLSDSRRLLFNDSVTSKIYLVDSRSRRVHDVVSAPPNEIGSPSISSDDRWL
jgi:Tol biopolymer transport system component